MTADPASTSSGTTPTGGSGAPWRNAVSYGAFPLVALGGTQFIQAGDLSSIGFAVDGIQDAFHISDFTVSTIPFAMAVAGLIGVLPFGYLADRWTRTILLAIGSVIWAAAMGVTGLAINFTMLILARMWV